jgi:hypothetical protein
MAQPFNYTINIPNPIQSMMGGVQNALSIANLVSQQRANEQAQQKKLQLQEDMAELNKNPTTTAVANMMVKYPELSDGFKKTYDVLSSEQQQARLSQASKVYAAINAGQTDIAQRLLSEQAEAYKNAGYSSDAKTLTDLSELVKASPKTAKTSIGMFLASTMGAEKFTDNFAKLESEARAAEKSPYELSQAQSKATQESVKARFAESEAVLDLQKKGWDITKLQEDIKIAKENSRIAAINAQIARENNVLKRQELGMKAQEMIDKREEAIREKAASAQSSFADMDNFLNTADKILSTPKDVIKSATGPISAKLPTVSQSTADFEALVETLGSQAFMSQIPKMKGLGALTEAEGKKLQSSLQNLSLTQSPEQFTANVKEAQRLILKARKNLADRTGIPQGVPDTPAAQPASSEIDALLKKYGGR